mmetsp:Transcript_21482/g.68607  ORF Transcript_21482/g.68607 Transcript_21482/m.68607 type:complete len:229 (+) Transcript_21482:513-1199(+)
MAAAAPGAASGQRRARTRAARPSPSSSSSRSMPPSSALSSSSAPSSAPPCALPPAPLAASPPLTASPPLASDATCRKAASALAGPSTMGSAGRVLKDVLSTSGTPVRAKKAAISARQRGSASPPTVWSRAEPSTWHTAGMASRRLHGSAKDMYGEPDGGTPSNQSPACSASTDGANGRKGSLFLTSRLRRSTAAAFRGSATIERRPRARGPYSAPPLAHKASISPAAR